MRCCGYCDPPSDCGVCNALSILCNLLARQITWYEENLLGMQEIILVATIHNILETASQRRPIQKPTT